MIAKQIKNIAASVRDRLLELSKESGIDFNRILLLYTQEKFLYRLMNSKYKENFILKGGVFFYGVFQQKARPTKDIDFLAKNLKNEKSEFKTVVYDIISQKVEDGLEFDQSTLSVKEITEAAEYQGLRIKVNSYLGKAHTVLQLDFGFGDIVYPQPILFDYPSLIDDGSFRIYSYSWESIIAEKFEAIVKLSDLNSRMKDFYDIWFMANNSKFDLENLNKAIHLTFNNRGTDIGMREVIFSEKFKNNLEKERQWQAFIKRNNLDLSIPFPDIIMRLYDFLKPVIDGKPEATGYKWNSDEWIWDK